MNASHSNDKPEEEICSQSKGNLASNSPTSNKRGRHAPQRYGDAATLELSDSFEDILILGDNSFDDRNFVPSEEGSDASGEKIVARIIRPIPSFKRTSKKSKIDRTPIKSRTTSNKSKQSDSQTLDVLATITSVNLDNEFDDLSEAPVENLIANRDVTMPVESLNADRDVLTPIENSIATHDVATTENTTADAIAGIFGMCQNILLEFRHYVKESLARVSIIEEAMIKNGTLNMHTAKIVNNIEDSRIFMKSNRLPIGNDADFKEFETNLYDENFKNVAVRLDLFSSVTSEHLV